MMNDLVSNRRTYLAVEASPALLAFAQPITALAMIVAVLVQAGVCKQQQQQQDRVLSSLDVAQPFCPQG
jgi:hypothetical protein